METDALISEFVTAAKRSYEYTLSGEWRKGNKETEKLTQIHAQLKAVGNAAMDKLLSLIKSEEYHVVLMACVYCMRYAPDACLARLEELAGQNIPHISAPARYSIMNWKNGEWQIG